MIFEGKNYKDLNLDAAISRYAPPKENNTAAYQQAVLSAVGGQNKAMSAYNSEERSKILDAMQRQEGYGSGQTQTTVLETSKSTPQAITSPSSGAQIDSSSKENKDLKDSLNKDKPSQIEMNSSQSSVNQKTQQSKEESVDDRPALLKKRRM